MSSYATDKQVRIRLKDYTNKQFDSDTILEGISRASGIIDAHLCNFYDTANLSSSVQIINQICVDLSASYVIGSSFQDYDQASSTWESKLHSMAMQLLRSIQDGIAHVPGVARIGV